MASSLLLPSVGLLSDLVPQLAESSSEEEDESSAGVPRGKHGAVGITGRGLSQQSLVLYLFSREPLPMG